MESYRQKITAQLGGDEVFTSEKISRLILGTDGDIPSSLTLTRHYDGNMWKNYAGLAASLLVSMDSSYTPGPGIIIQNKDSFFNALTINDSNGTQRIGLGAVTNSTKVMLNTYDNNTGLGPQFHVGYNNNDVTPVPGVIVLYDINDGTPYYLWAGSSNGSQGLRFSKTPPDSTATAYGTKLTNFPAT